jgi:hypothetical protein
MNMRNHFLAMLVAAFCVVGHADEDQADTKATAKAWQEHYTQAARQYAISLDAAGEKYALLLRDKPVLDWTSIEDYNGAVFVWTRNKRPEVVGTFFSLPRDGTKKRLVVHEFASFSFGQVQLAEQAGREWRPPPLKQFTAVPDAPPPARTAQQRRLQSRQLARPFSAHMNRRGKRWELRLLPKPVLEYDAVSDEVLGGALFLFVAYSTDPDILLLLEAHQTDSGTQWVYQPIRFSDKSLFLSYNKRNVWQSLRGKHGPAGPDTADPQYTVLKSETVAVTVPAEDKEDCVAQTQCDFGLCDDQKDGETEQTDKRLEFMRGLIGAIKVKPDDRDSRVATRFNEEPLLRFGDSVRNASDGSLWKLGAGRPQAIVGIEFQTVNGKPSLGYEFLCLTEEKFELKGGDNWTWTPTKSALEFKPIAAARPPHESATVRLRQMKQLARRFSATETHKGEQYVLRLLPQPIDQYVFDQEREDHQGAIFVFAHGTNPEVALLVESRENAWKYALGRLAGAEVTVKLADRIVWTKRPMYKVGLSWQGEYICVNHPIDSLQPRSDK